MTGDTIYVGVHREDRIGMVSEDMSDMMIMVVPTQIFQQETNNLSG